MERRFGKAVGDFISNQVLGLEYSKQAKVPAFLILHNANKKRQQFSSD